MAGPVRRALLSLADKTEGLGFAQGLAALGVEVLSTGGTAALLRGGGVKVREVSEETGFPEILGGRVKTLHPKIHGGILARREIRDDSADLARHGITPLDLVAVTLYPFEETAAKPGVSLAEALEQVDIGGVTLLRAAAKNHPDVTVVCDPDDYGPLLAEMRANGGATTPETRAALARKAFARTAVYDAAISTWLGAAPGTGLPDTLLLAFRKVSDLRYGENPHQRGAFYRVPGAPTGLAAARQLSGKELSYTNLLDLSGALRCVGEFPGPAAVVVKHATPCGVATGESPASAVERAIAGDPLSAFGGVVALNRPLDAAALEVIAAKGNFFEAIAVPGAPEGLAARLRARGSWGESVRLVEASPAPPAAGALLVRSVPGGALVQEDDAAMEESSRWAAVTSRAPTEAERDDLRFAWTVAKHVTSNAIVLASRGATVGIGGGQTSRVDSVEIALRKAGGRARGAVLASDAFFPFRDSVDLAARAGVTAIVQPGGSKKDTDSVAAADSAGIAMVFTGTRHFRH
ncbi:MAG: bifunctional phosphoribosylaminoimidazolecarboxamide formyltransferase/IMP cyclohydrolase [Planctomycetales bacterium]|nr:bifunctional phosphoribosylaminoimidazolecarboxamide formyltransferase/IMP cyclohydrolase [Planctomycetales bacterium]